MCPGHKLLQSTCKALEEEVVAKTTFKGKLDTYRFCDNVRRAPFDEFTYSAVTVLHCKGRCKAHMRIDVLMPLHPVWQVWTFVVSDATFKTNASGQGSTNMAPEVHVDKVKIVAVSGKPCDLLCGSSTTALLAEVLKIVAVGAPRGMLGLSYSQHVAC